MKFTVVITEPHLRNRGHFRYDLARLLAGSIESLGHDCTISRNLPDPGRMNLIVGGHTIYEEKHLALFQSPQVRYGIIQTDRLLDVGLPYGPEKALFENFYTPMLQGAQFIWDFQANHLPRLEELGLSAQRLSIGYDPALAYLPPKAERDFDFFFFGQVTPHRQQLLLRLQGRGHGLQHCDDTDPFFRDDLIARARVHVDPRWGDAGANPSFTRLATLLTNGYVVVVEEGGDLDGLEDCVVTAPTDQWVQCCSDTLARSDLDQLAETFHQRFKSRPMTECLAPLLEDLQ